MPDEDRLLSPDVVTAISILLVDGPETIIEICIKKHIIIFNKRQELSVLDDEICSHFTEAKKLNLFLFCCSAFKYRV